MNDILGIDLSLRSTGLCYNNEFKLIQIEKLKNEELLIELIKQICYYINLWQPKQINLEGLSFNSISGSKDLIAGSFWFLRSEIKRQYPNIPLKILSVSEWRAPLFNKEENKTIREAKNFLKTNKKSIKNLKGIERKQVQEYNKILEDNANIKVYTFNKLPEDIKQKIINITEDKSRFDLTDAYFISRNK